MFKIRKLTNFALERVHSPPWGRERWYPDQDHGKPLQERPPSEKENGWPAGRLGGARKERERRRTKDDDIGVIWQPRDVFEWTQAKEHLPGETQHVNRFDTKW